ncbi:MAG: hypothetical protein ACR2PK_12800 [Acidimicrobiales bacterium]
MIAVAALLAAACSGTDDMNTPDASEPAQVANVAEAPSPASDSIEAAAPPTTVTFAANVSDAPWDLVGIGDSFIGWSTVTEQYAALLSNDLGIEINVAKIVQPTSNRLEYIRTHDAAQGLLAGAEIVVVEPQPGPSTEPGMGLYLAGECGGPDNQECFRIAQADFGLYVGELFDELIARTPAETTIVATLVGTWGSAGFNPGIEETDPDAHRAFVDHLVALQDLGAAAAAERGIATVDVSLALTGPDYYQPVPNAYLTPDRLHLTQEGSEVVAELLRSLSASAPAARTSVGFDWVSVPAASVPAGSFAVTKDGFVVAGHEGSLWSSDNGTEWAALSPPAHLSSEASISSLNGAYWLIDGASTWRSDDLVSWEEIVGVDTPIATSESAEADVVPVATDEIVLVGASGSGGSLIFSDGETAWSEPSPWGAVDGHVQVVATRSTFVAYQIGTDSADTWTTSDGRTWVSMGAPAFTQRNLDSAFKRFEVIYRDGEFLAQVGEGLSDVGSIWRSEDGIIWTEQGATPFADDMFSGLIRATNTGWILTMAGCGGEKVLVSSDGVEWEDVTPFAEPQASCSSAGGGTSRNHMAWDLDSHDQPLEVRAVPGGLLIRHEGIGWIASSHHP